MWEVVGRRALEAQWFFCRWARCSTHTHARAHSMCRPRVSEMRAHLAAHHIGSLFIEARVCRPPKSGVTTVVQRIDDRFSARAHASNVCVCVFVCVWSVVCGVQCVGSCAQKRRGVPDKSAHSVCVYAVFGCWCNINVELIMITIFPNIHYAVHRVYHVFLLTQKMVRPVMVIWIEQYIISRFILFMNSYICI